MQANLSLVLNVILLIGVVIAIGRLMKTKRQANRLSSYQPPLGKVENKSFDDIISVRKVNSNLLNEEDLADVQISASENDDKKPMLRGEVINKKSAYDTNNEAGPSVMMFLLAKENRQLAGYELLQTVLAAGLRFGEGHLFHRHQYSNGQGPILCSLAAATPTGVFDLQNIGGFSVRGLCLFMHSSGNPTIDKERFTIMLDTAKQLSDELDTLLLDEKKRPLTAESLKHYYQLLHIADISDIKEFKEKEIV
ncbi:cell division protein ZipA C-terminal FtsZ-binding domain-containing protein [Legionella gresilensis]|uniref:cell division protein ZipA C-terminal FtsZ-binding domain-containing protein n=1 Tax=Legionella gresilensis TaxID=91823 RepID=UPI001040F204|nr:cell division protein ZipA C-terminal FtsZ-binding domain-containing protein [Legionella gresilensis]